MGCCSKLPPGFFKNPGSVIAYRWVASVRVVTVASLLASMAYTLTHLATLTPNRVLLLLIHVAMAWAALYECRLSERQERSRRAGKDGLPPP